MATHLTTAGADPTLLYAGSVRERMPFLDELHGLLGDRLQILCSAEGRRLEPELPAGIAAANANPDRVEAYVCGPLAMLDDVRRAWTSRGLRRTNLRFETFAGGTGHGSPFSLSVPSLDLQTEVGPEESLLDALARCGAPVLYDCLRGECGLCVLPVVCVDGVLEHHDVFLSEEQKESSGLICTCVSRVRPTAESAPAITLALP